MIVLTNGMQFFNKIYNRISECEQLSFLETGVLLPNILENFNEKLNENVAELEFRILRRITETQYHADDLYECKLDELKYNRYSDILPCNINYFFIAQYSQANEGSNKSTTWKYKNFLYKR